MRVGLIGCGRQGRRRSNAIKSANDELKVVADIDKEQASLLSKEMACEFATDWKAVVERNDVDAIVVSTPNYLHAPMCIAAMERGKHVMCEKPLARNPEEAEEIVKMAEKTGVTVKCGFSLRYHPGIQAAKKMSDEGRFGEAYFLRIRYGICGREGYDKEWRASRELAGGGQLMDQGIHALDLARWFLGDFVDVSGYVANNYWKSADVEDNAFCLLRTAKHQIASIHVSWTQWKNLFSFELYGKKGYATVEGLGGSYGTEELRVGKQSFDYPFVEEVSQFHREDVWLQEWREFTSAIANKRRPLDDCYDGLEAIKLAYAIYRFSHGPPV